jgi:neutral ceramidase
MRARSLSLLFAFATLGSAGSQIKAGAASVSIAPHQPAWLAGSAGRSHPSESTSGDLRARALMVDDGLGGRAVLISVELLAIPRNLTEVMAADIMKALGLERGQILINATGTRSAPYVQGLHPVLAPSSVEERRRVAEYTAVLSHSLVDLAAEAFSNMQPARISIDFGRASFAVNAPLRAALDASNPAGPVDTTVPVLRVETTSGRMLAVVFGYACRAAALDTNSYAVSGDYPGFAAARVERDFPGAVALFLRLCDGDQAPSPRGSASLANLHGVALAKEVGRLLKSPMQPVTGRLRATLIETSLAFSPSTQAELEEESKSGDPVRARWARRLLAAHDARIELLSMPYPVQVIRFGKGFAIVALGGEPSVSYALRIRKLLAQDHLLIAGGTNDAGYFVPCAEQSNSGDTDSADSIVYSGFPGPFTGEAEERVLDAVKRAWNRVLK